MIDRDESIREYDGEGDMPMRTSEIKMGITAIREEADTISANLSSLEKIISPVLGEDQAKTRIAGGLDSAKTVADRPGAETPLGRDLQEVYENYRTLRIRISNLVERVRL